MIMIIDFWLLKYIIFIEKTTQNLPLQAGTEGALTSQKQALSSISHPHNQDIGRGSHLRIR
jgi:hypothetical protein